MPTSNFTSAARLRCSAPCTRTTWLASRFGADASLVRVEDLCRIHTLYRQAALLLAAGASLDVDELETTPADRAAAFARVPHAKKQIELAGFAAIRARVLEICVALQDLELPALQLVEIVTATVHFRKP